MGLPNQNDDSDVSPMDPFRADLSQEDFDREFYGQILKRGDSNTDVVRRQAELLSRHGDYESALVLDRVLIQRHPDDAVAHYNLACSLSMNGDCFPAVQALGRAIALGYCDFAHIHSDTDLDPLRDMPSFHELLRRRIPDDVPPHIV